MTLEELKALLEAGTITREQFDALSAALEAGQGGSGEEKPPKEDRPPDAGPTQADIDRMVQQAVDRATSKLGQENKQLRDANEKLKREKMSDEERQKADLDEREKAILDRENRFFAVKAIKEAGLDDGSELSLRLVDHVMADSEEQITQRVADFGALVKQFVKAEVDRTFKDSGYIPQKGGGTAPAVNPWKKGDGYSLEKQTELFRTNPEEAKKLAAAAGVKL